MDPHFVKVHPHHGLVGSYHYSTRSRPGQERLEGRGLVLFALQVTGSWSRCEQAETDVYQRLSPDTGAILPRAGHVNDENVEPWIGTRLAVPWKAEGGPTNARTTIAGDPELVKKGRVSTLDLSSSHSR